MLTKFQVLTTHSSATLLRICMKSIVTGSLPHQQTLATVVTQELFVVPSVKPFRQKLLVVLVRVNQIHQSVYVTEKKKRSYIQMKYYQSCRENF